jgi:hypothetical protein
VLPLPIEWLVELERFTVPTRQLTRPGTVGEDILAAVSALVDDRGVFRVTDELRLLNPTRDQRRDWTLKRTLVFMVDGGRGRAPEFERVRRGEYRLKTLPIR